MTDTSVIAARVPEFVRVFARTGPGHRDASPAVAIALGLDPGAVLLEHAPTGAPRLTFGQGETRVSIAHTTGLTLVAVASGTDVGVDVEWLGRDATGWRLWGQILSAEESLALPDDREDRNAVLLQSWVRREALLKAAGAGLAVEPRAIELTPQGGIRALPSSLGAPATWSIVDLALSDYASALAFRVADPTLDEPDERDDHGVPQRRGPLRHRLAAGMAATRGGP